MRKLRLIGIYLSALLLAGACSRMEEKSALNIYVRLPEQEEFTKAAPDWAALQAKETRINDLRIWVFLASTTDGSQTAGTLLGYLEPKQLNYSGGRVQKFVVPLDRTLASKLQTVDVYVLANAGAARLTDSYAVGQNTTRDELDALVLKDDPGRGGMFGIDADGEPTSTDIIDNVGLPYTAVGKGLTLSSSANSLSVASVELTRAVSKVQFVFSQIEVGGIKPVDFQITGLQLNTGMIPEEEYLFNPNPSVPKIGSSYVARPVEIANLPTRESIIGSASPGGFRYDGSESAADYQVRIDRALRNGAVTGLAPVYLRESDKTLSGVVKYKFGDGEERTTAFSMVAGEKFARNSNWIVFFYFNNNFMGLSVSYSSWYDGGKYEIIGN